MFEVCTYVSQYYVCMYVCVCVCVCVFVCVCCVCVGIKHVSSMYIGRNGPVKAKFAYLCTNGCYNLRNTLLVKLCTS